MSSRTDIGKHKASRAVGRPAGWFRCDPVGRPAQDPRRFCHSVDISGFQAWPFRFITKFGAKTERAIARNAEVDRAILGASAFGSWYMMTSLRCSELVLPVLKSNH